MAISAGAIAFHTFTQSRYDESPAVYFEDKEESTRLAADKNKPDFGPGLRNVQTYKSTNSVARPGYPYSVYFEYVGNTGLTVIGSATNKKYCFNGAGSRVEVDPRGRPSLAKVPNLREVTAIDGV